MKKQMFSDEKMEIMRRNPNICFWDNDPAPPVTHTQTQSNAPWGKQAPYLEAGFGRAQSDVLNTPVQYYGGDTFVPFSSQTEQSLTGAENLASGGAPIIDQAGNVLESTLHGDYLEGGNPAFAAMAERAISPLRQEYQNVVAPGIDASFSMGGRYGSGIARQNAQGMAADRYMRQVGDIGAGLSYGDFQAERGYQNQAVGRAPGMYESQFMPHQRMAEIGAAREGMSREILADEINRFNFGQQEPRTRIGDYMGLVGGGYGGSSTQTSMTPQQQSNPWLTGLGVATGMAGIGSNLFGQQGIWPQ